jgi:flagellar protein FlaG
MDSLSSVAGSLSTAFARPNAPVPAGAAVAGPAAQQSLAPTEPKLRPVLSSQGAEQADFSGNNKDGDKKQTVEQAVKDINDFFQNVNRVLEFSIDNDSNRLIIEVRDMKTNQIIRQIPPDDILKLAKQLEKVEGLLSNKQPEKVEGLLFSDKA